MNKKIITAVAVTAAAASMSAAYAKDITVSVNGKNVEFDQPPVIDNDRTLVPMRAIFEALGATVDWDGETRTVTSTKGDTTIKLTIDSADMYVGENVITLDVPAKIISDRTMVPVRAISEAMACKVDWDGENQAVIITTEETKATVAPEPTLAPETSAAPEATAAPASSGTSGASSSASSAVSTEQMEAKEGVNTYVPSLSVGKIDTTTGELDSSATEQSTTDYAPVNGGKQYFAAVYHPNVLQYTNLCKTYAFYDADKKFISGGTDDMSKLITAPANAAYIRYTIELPTTSRNTLYVNFMETSTVPTDFTKSEAITKNAKTDKLADSSIYLLCDGSVTSSDAWLTTVDVALNAKQLYIKAEDGLRYVGQTGVALAADSYIAGLPKSGYDKVIVDAGSYDWTQNVSISEFETAAKKFATSLKKRFPDADIYLMTIPNGKNSSFADGITNESGSSNADYSAVIKKVAEAEGLNVIDIASLWGQEDVEKYLRNTDGNQFLFANDAGSELITNAIVEALTK
jgi:hypothetical protein